MRHQTSIPFPAQCIIVSPKVDMLMLLLALISYHNVKEVKHTLKHQI